MHQDLHIAKVLGVLERARFITSERCNVRAGNFDFVARRRHLLLILKVLNNIDGLSACTANEMRCLAECLFGSPIVIGEMVNKRLLERGAVHLRYGIPSINVETLYDFFVESAPPLVYAAPGGLYVHINGDVLREVRIDKNISLGELASRLGVSRRTISKYEGGMGLTVEMALKIESILDVPLARPIGLLYLRSQKESPQEAASPSSIERAILSMLIDMGFDVIHMAHAPFNVLSQDRTVTILAGVSRYTDTMMKKARFMSSVSDVANTISVFIIDGASKSSQIENTVLVERDELENVDDSGDFITLIQDRMNKSTKII